jgi:hypothetical protein
VSHPDPSRTPALSVDYPARWASGVKSCTGPLGEPGALIQTARLGLVWGSEGTVAVKPPRWRRLVRLIGLGVLPVLLAPVLAARAQSTRSDVRARAVAVRGASIHPGPRAGKQGGSPCMCTDAAKPPFLSVAHAKAAILATIPHGVNSYITDCHHLSARKVGCTLTEEEVSPSTTPAGVGVISILEGRATATLYRHPHPYIRVHYVGAPG